MASAREKVKLVSPDGKSFRTTTRNKRKNPEKLSLSKYNPQTRRHEKYDEKGKLK